MSVSVNAKEPVFPSELHQRFQYPGLTKRELFTAMAMQGLLSDSEKYVGALSRARLTAQIAVAFADAVLSELATVYG